MYTAEGFTYDIEGEVIIKGNSTEKCYSLDTSYEDEKYKREGINNISNILINQNSFPINISLVECGLNICEDLDELSLPYSVDYGEENALYKMKYSVINIHIHNRKDLKTAVELSFQHASYGDRIVISTGCQLYNTIRRKMWSNHSRRFVEFNTQSNSTVIYSDTDDLIWSLMTNFPEYMNKKSLDRFLSVNR